jgi:hypothetical protein
MANGAGCCLWYWDGANWYGPTPNGYCPSCANSTHPDNPPNQPGMVCVPCPPQAEAKVQRNSQCCANFPIPDGYYLFFPANSPSLLPFIPEKHSKSQVRPKPVPSARKAR